MTATLTDTYGGLWKGAGLLRESRETIPSVIRDYPEWHLGRTDYGVWLIELDGDEVLGTTEAARRHLGALLLSPYERQPHITLFVCGFLVDRPRMDDDYGREQLESHSVRLKEAGISRFSLQLGGLNSFASAPFLEVADPGGGIGRIRSVLAKTEREIRKNIYTPHMTVGLYSGIYPAPDVLRRIAAFRSRPVRVMVERVTFATYSSREISGPLTGRVSVPLLSD